ncbi:hypothetical protein HW555_003105 [Spodoptera exigua]|uniref:Uncharacterized protein n=1 Tax=Spodoptera exigua TaxID=7107 RepID=A0A835GPA2_SPOEX|nr:hypothetical protein HW555_003105 [Spodoptera exigua]
MVLRNKDQWTKYEEHRLLKKSLEECWANVARGDVAGTSAVHNDIHVTKNVYIQDTKSGLGQSVTKCKLLGLKFEGESAGLEEWITRSEEAGRSFVHHCSIFNLHIQKNNTYPASGSKACVSRPGSNELSWKACAADQTPSLFYREQQIFSCHGSKRQTSFVSKGKNLSTKVDQPLLPQPQLLASVCMFFAADHTAWPRPSFR